MKMPTDDEIRAKAAELALDPKRDRGRVAAAVQADKLAAVQAEAEAADPLAGPTAAILAKFDRELLGADILGDSRARVLAVAATYLIETQGLCLDPSREETTPS